MTEYRLSRSSNGRSGAWILCAAERNDAATAGIRAEELSTERYSQMSQKQSRYLYTALRKKAYYMREAGDILGIYMSRI
jgi:hypothetical protein